MNKHANDSGLCFTSAAARCERAVYFRLLVVAGDLAALDGAEGADEGTGEHAGSEAEEGAEAHLWEDADNQNNGRAGDSGVSARLKWRTGGIDFNKPKNAQMCVSCGHEPQSVFTKEQAGWRVGE